jgi:peptidyl-prolyl cis-trans isomerase SurA
LKEEDKPIVPEQYVYAHIVRFPSSLEEAKRRTRERLLDMRERIISGKSTMTILARTYSQDPGSAMKGGEYPHGPLSGLTAPFAEALAKLKPGQISEVVESEFGFHIIQLVEKRGDKVNVRHILKKPVVSDEAIEKAIDRLDSIAADIRKEQFSFEEAASLLSDDKDTRNNKGLMSNTNMQTGRISSKFQMQELPQEVAKVVDTMQVGQISQAFQMINQRGKTVCAIVKLKNRVDGHKASITEDFQVMKDVVLNKRNEECIHQWVVDKIKSVYTRLNDNYRDCKFEYEGWFK